MPVVMKESYFKPVQKDLELYFFELFWKDILELMKDPQYRLNSTSYLLTAIRTGKIFYQNGVFTGTFNSRTSRELQKFAVYDGRTKTWKGTPPPEVISAATVANSKSRQLVQRIESLIAEIPSRVEDVIDSLKYSIDAPLFSMAAEADKDLESIGVRPEMTPELSDRLIREYTTNQNINIKNWTPEQTKRLRDMVERNVLSGYNKEELIQSIQSEYETTMNKARFLARQETNLVMAAVRDERYKDAGIKVYKWSNSGDVRVVGNPSGKFPDPTKGHGNHWVMGGKYCKLDDPTVYADSLEDAKAGNWKSKSSIGADNLHPGQAFQCRCTSIPVVI